MVPAADVEVNRDEAEDALPPSGEDPRPEELDEAVEEEEADLPTLGRPNSPFPPSHNGRPLPIIVDVVIEPNPEDSLRLPLEILSLLASDEELFPPMPFPPKMDDRAVGPGATAAIPPLKLSLSIEGVGDVGPPIFVNKEDSPTVEFAFNAVCITDCSIFWPNVCYHT